MVNVIIRRNLDKYGLTRVLKDEGYKSDEKTLTEFTKNVTSISREGVTLDYKKI